MTNCIKTGAYVYFEPYGAYTPADIFNLGSDYLVLRLNREEHWLYSPYPGMRVTHSLRLPDDSDSFFFAPDKRTVVVPKECVEETPNELCKH